MATLERIESIRESGGWLNRYRHHSAVLNCEMVFSVFLPPAAEHGPVPALYWLSGLTCTDDNARTKGGMQRYAAEHGLAIAFPDTSPRGGSVPDADRYDLGQGAGFYVNASEAPWNAHYRMYDYIVDELPALVEAELPLSGRRSVSGHSMGGHGALVIGLRNPQRYAAISAFAPVAHPIASAWGREAFTTYLGGDPGQWAEYDATELVKSGARPASGSPAIRIEQGTADEFFDEQQLLPHDFEAACRDAGVALDLHLREGYDHSYHFIASFAAEHFALHASALHNTPG